MARRNYIVWFLVFLGWMLVGLSFSLNDYLFVNSLAQYYRAAPTLRSMLYWDLAYWPTWALLAPLIFWLARRFPLGRGSWARNLILHFLLGLLLIVPQRAIYLTIAWTLQQMGGEHIPLTDLYRDFLFYNLPTGFMSYGVILLGGVLLNFYHEYQQEKVRSARLRAELEKAQLQALKMQLQPHFLFNTFNSISAMLHDDPKAADEMLAQLGDFLRTTLENSGEQMVTLETELEFVRRYLSIEQVRLQDRLQVEYVIPAAVLSARVPNLLLQPIIENVIKHGVGQTYDRVQLQITAVRENGQLRLVIANDLKDPKLVTGDPREGFGLANTRARLRSAYGEDFQLSLGQQDGGGFVTCIELPWDQKTDRG